MNRTGLLLMMCAAGIGDGRAAEPAGAMNVAQIVVSAAHTHELTGPFRFQTLFGDLAGLVSPTVTGSGPDGRLTFNPRTTSTPGGYAQITFVDVNATFRMRCEVGRTAQPFDIVFSETGTGGGSERVSVTSGLVGTKAVFEASAKPMRTRGDFVIRISSDLPSQQWDLIRCDITAQPKAVPNAPVLTVK